MVSEKIKGLVAATVTPMKANGEVNLPALDSYVKHLEKQGLAGVFVNGTTGEGLLMTSEERKAVAEAWMAYKDKFKVMIHVGGTSYAAAVDLARHAEQIGADAISAMGPCFLPPYRAEELVAFNKIIAAAAPNTPFYYYHIPGTSHVNVNMLDFLKLGEKEIPTLRGIKYTTYDSMTMQECIAYRDGYYDILHGHDETILTGLMLGATGGVGTSYSVTGELYNKMLNTFWAGDVAGAVKLQEEAVKFIRVLIKYENSVVGIKAILQIMGVDCGSVRLPMRNLTPDRMKSLEADLRAIGWI